MGLEIDHYLVMYAEVVFIFTYAPTVANFNVRTMSTLK